MKNWEIDLVPYDYREEKCSLCQKVITEEQSNDAVSDATSGVHYVFCSIECFMKTVPKDDDANNS